MEKIKELILEIQPDIDLTKDIDLVGDGYLDSLDIIKLVTLLESRFSISIPGSEIDPENFRNVSRIEKLVQKFQA